MDMTSYLLGRKSSGGSGGDTKPFDYIIDARSIINLSNNGSFAITNQSVLSQLQQILTDGVYDSERNLKPLRIGLRTKKDSYDYDYSFLTLSMISDETEDTYDEQPYGNYLAYHLNFIYTMGNIIKYVTLIATTETGVANAEWQCIVANITTA